MEDFGIKHLTIENWLQPDNPSQSFMGLSDGQIYTMSGEDWARQILRSKLPEETPCEIQKLYAVAQGIMIYGWFFYPLYTLGIEQLSRVAEAAISYKCKSLNAPTSVDTFTKKVNWLARNSVIPENEKDKWDSVRRLRNLASHLESQTILTPGFVARMLEKLTERINSLFVTA